MLMCMVCKHFEIYCLIDMSMQIDNFVTLILSILQTATKLKNKYTNELDAQANYVCIFCHSEKELVKFSTLASFLGNPVLETNTGQVFHVIKRVTQKELPKLLKIRKPDSTRLERGDADFTVSDYQKLKATCLGRKGFSVIPLKDAEMIELIDPEFDVRVYFSDPPLDVELGL